MNSNHDVCCYCQTPVIEIGDRNDATVTECPKCHEQYKENFVIGLNYCLECGYPFIIYETDGITLQTKYVCLKCREGWNKLC